MRNDRFTGNPEQLFDQDPETWTLHSMWKWHAYDERNRDPYTGKELSD